MTPERRLLRTAVAEVDDAVAERARLEELEVDTSVVCEEGFASAESHGVDEHVVLVDELVRARRGLRRLRRSAPVFFLERLPSAQDRHGRGARFPSTASSDFEKTSFGSCFQIRANSSWATSSSETLAGRRGCVLPRSPRTPSPRRGVVRVDGGRARLPAGCGSGVARHQGPPVVSVRSRDGAVERDAHRVDHRLTPLSPCVVGIPERTRLRARGSTAAAAKDVKAVPVPPQRLCRLRPAFWRQEQSERYGCSGSAV